MIFCYIYPGASNGSEETMRKTIDLYFKFMWNRWSYGHSKGIFGDLGDHLWDKWLGIRDDYDPISAAAIFWSQIDSNCQTKICEYIKTSGYKG